MVTPLYDFPVGAHSWQCVTHRTCTCVSRTILICREEIAHLERKKENQHVSALTHAIVLCTVQSSPHVFCPKRTAVISFHVIMKRLVCLPCVTLLILRLCCANCNLAGVGGDGSHWYCQSPCFPITIAGTPTWLPDWQCYFRGNYYDSDYVNHFTLCSMWHQIAVALATRFLFLLLCLMAVWGIFFLFTVEKLFKNSCSVPLQCYYLWAR